MLTTRGEPPGNTTAGDGFAGDLLACLEFAPHEISPKYFYDAAGSRLFEQICELPEYYLTRTELGILDRDLTQMAKPIGPHAEIIEFGAGSLHKARMLLAALDRPRRFIAVDLSSEHLMASAARLQEEFPAVEVIAVVADFSDPGALRRIPPPQSDSRRIGFFPGSTLGNFTLPEAGRFLRAASLLLAGGGLLIGVDLVKDPALLHRAYNDAAGITAAFNRNLLVRANRELGAGFRVNDFVHYAFYQPGLQRVEMHLVCLAAQRIALGAREFTLHQGESLHTENSQKYTIEGFRALAQASGLEPREVWCDPARLFSVHWLESTSLSTVEEV
jgi:dimethylhistidine N-methyltransferase